MAQMVMGLFENRDNVESVIGELKTEGFNAQDVSIVMKDTSEAHAVGEATGSNVVGGAASGVATGAVVGGLAGLVASAIMPGLGALFIGGPLATALGLSGAAASTVSGAATGAVAGGLIGALTGFGVSEATAKQYERRIGEGAILVAVPTTDENAGMVKDTFNRFDASDVQTVDSTPTE